MLKELLVSLMITGTPIAISDISSVEQFTFDEATCLAQNVYHEAKNQPQVGQMAVMSVTLNRVSDDRFPDTICEVVKEGPSRPSWKGTGEMIPVRHKCQFSWWCDGKSDKIHKQNQEIYNDIFVFTLGIVSGKITLLDVTEGATHYHADYVSPSWASSKTKTVEIEDHIFYRWEKK